MKWPDLLKITTAEGVVYPKAQILRTQWMDGGMEVIMFVHDVEHVDGVTRPKAVDPVIKTEGKR